MARTRQQPPPSSAALSTATPTPTPTPTPTGTMDEVPNPHTPPPSSSGSPTTPSQAAAAFTAVVVCKPHEQHPSQSSRVPDLEFPICFQGKMKAQSYKDPPLQLKINQARKLEDLSNFVFLGLTMCYGVVFYLYSAFLGKKGGNMRVVTGLYIWTTLLIVLLFLPVLIGSIIRISFGTVKVMRLVMSGLLLVSSAFVFILLLLQLGLF